MKNLKKVLSLVLALAMALSLMTVAFAKDASDFADYNEVANNEAVDVMVAVGVFNGADGNNFDPNGELTREQAAKIVTYMLLGQEKADKLTATAAPYADVAKDRWSAGAIAYCTEQGILAGSNGKFDPTGKLTGQAFAKMLLCALGYDAKVEGLTGSAWAINASALAVTTGLDENLGALSAVMTREEAAQMAFNAEKATMVEYSGGVDVSTSDGTSVKVGAVRSDVKSTKAKDYHTVPAKQDELMQFCEQNAKDLKLTTGESDDFGAPADKWTYKNAEVGTYASDVDATFTGKVTYGDLYTAIGSTAVKRLNAVSTASTLTVKVDNKVPTTSVTANKITKGSDEEIAFTGKGVTTSVYVKDSATAGEYDVTIVAVNTYVGKVSSVTKATASADRYINVTNKGTSVDLKDNGKFETEAFAKDDYVLFTAAWNGSKYEVKTVAAAEKVSAAEVTTIKGTSEFTAAGTTYKYAATYNASIEIGNAYDLYLDANGYVAYAELVNEAVDYSNYIVITKDAKESGLDDKIIANAVKMDGTMVSNITLGKLDSSKITAESKDSTGVKVTLNQLYSFTVGSDGKYNLKAVTTPYGRAAVTLANNNGGDGYKYHVGYTKLDDTYSANNATTFVVYNNDKDTVTVYNGIKNMVNIANAATVTTDVLYKTAGTAKLVYINTSATSTNAASAKDLVYLLDTTPVQSKDGDDTIYTYAALVNGEVSTIKTKTEIKVSGLTNAAADQKLYYISSYEDGYVTAMAAPTNNTPEDYAYKTATGKAATYADGVFAIADNGSYVLADKCALYSIDKDGNVSTISAEELENTDTTIEYTVVTKTSNKVVEAIAIYVQATK